MKNIFAVGILFALNLLSIQTTTLAQETTINRGKFAVRTFTSTSEEGNKQANYASKFAKSAWTPSFTSRDTEGLTSADYRESEFAGKVPAFGSEHYEGYIAPVMLAESVIEEEPESVGMSVGTLILSVFIAFALGFLAALILFKYAALNVVEASS